MRSGAALVLVAVIARATLTAATQSLAGLFACQVALAQPMVDQS